VNVKKKTARSSFVSLAFVLLATSAGACGRSHLSSQFAQSYTAWFTAQHVRGRASPEETRRIIESLDSQEASAVSKNYRKGVSRGDEAGVSRMLTIGAPRAGGGEYVPPPSVP
jgi:hypothetical protein